MRGTIRKRKSGGYEAVYDVGDQPCQRCVQCRRRTWTSGRTRLTACDRCGGALVDGVERRQKFETHRTRREAQAALNAALERVRKGEWSEPSSATVRAFLGEWLEAATAQRKPTTMAGYRTNVDAYIVPRLGGEQLRHLTPPKINAMYADLLARGSRAGMPLSEKTVRYVHTTLRRALEDGVAWGYLPANPAAKANPPTPDAPEVRVPEPAQVSRFLAAERQNRYSAAFRLLAATGCRRGEVLGLAWSDVDLVAGTMTVRRSLTVARNRPLFDTPKSRKGRPKTRTLSLDARTIAALGDHRRRFLEERLALGPGGASHRPRSGCRGSLRISSF